MTQPADSARTATLSDADLTAMNLIAARRAP
jgi:hypothetical protein